MEKYATHHSLLPSIRSIAVFRALQLGDMLCIIPAVRSIKKAYPDARIALVGLPWARNFVERFSHYFEDFIEFKGWPGLPERSYCIQDIMEFLHEIQSRRFDLVLQMQGNGYIVNPMCMLWGSRYVAGLRKENDFGEPPELFPVMNEEEHEVLRFLKVARAVGADVTDTSLEFPIMERERERLVLIREKLGLQDGQPYVCLHPGARDPRRRWPAEYFAYVGDCLSRKGYTVLLTGSGEEQELLEHVEHLMIEPLINLVALCGNIGIGELAGLINGSAALVSNDTGVSHVAAALKKRSVIIFSAYSDPHRWAPLDKELHIRIMPESADDPQKVCDVVSDFLEDPISENVKSTLK